MTRGAASTPLGRAALLAIALAFLGVFLVAPLVAVFAEALSTGFAAYGAALIERDAFSAVRLTLLVAALSVPLTIVFGLAASWAIAKFDFRGKSVLITLIHLPFSVSPRVSGLIYVLLFGAQGWLGPWLQAHEGPIVFALPGHVWETLFIHHTETRP